MPELNGYPYPNSSASPDVPGDILALIQRLVRLNRGGVGYAADAAGLAQLVTDGLSFDGQLVLQADTLTIVQRKSSTWVATLEDTGWINATLLNSWTTSSGLTVAYRRLNGVVYGRGQATNGAAGTIIFQLPAGYRPAQTFKCSTTNTDGSTSYRLNITTGGDVSVSNANTGATPVIEFCFPVG